MQLKEMLREEAMKKKMAQYDKSMLDKMTDSSLIELCKQTGKTNEEAMAMSKNEMIKHLIEYSGVKEAGGMSNKTSINAPEGELKIAPAQVLYRDENDKDVPIQQATKHGVLYYLDDEHNIVSKEEATLWTITWTSMKTGDFLGDVWGQVIQK